MFSRPKLDKVMVQLTSPTSHFAVAEALKNLGIEDKSGPNPGTVLHRPVELAPQHRTFSKATGMSEKRNNGHRGAGSNESGHHGGAALSGASEKTRADFRSEMVA
jgi:hypothetical protein